MSGVEEWNVVVAGGDKGDGEEKGEMEQRLAKAAHFGNGKKVQEYSIEAEGDAMESRPARMEFKMKDKSAIHALKS